MATKESLIKQLIEKKKKEEYEKKSSQFYDASLKITKAQENPKIITNSYSVSDPNTCPDIFRGEEYIKKLSLPTVRAVHDYTGSGYSVINRNLRAKMSVSSDCIKLLDIAFNGAPPLESALTVYRGVRNFVEIRDDLGYSSCSLKESVSTAFGGGSCYTIILPAGCKVLFVCPISCVKSECEVLVNRSGIFRAINDKGNVLVYENSL